MDPFFVELEKRRIQNKAKKFKQYEQEINRIVSELKSKIGNTPSGTVTVLSMCFERIVRDTVATKVGEVTIQVGSPLDGVRYTVEW